VKMVEHVANILIYKMMNKNLLSEENECEYCYAITTLIEKAITVSVIWILSAIWHVYLPTFFFLLFLFGIRKHTGGYHANKFRYCFISTVSIYIIFVILIYPVMLKHMLVSYWIMVLSGITIVLIGAINHPNIDWDRSEHEASKRLARKIVVMEIMIVTTLSVLGIDDVYIIFMVFAIILSALLLLLGKIFHQEVRKNEESKY